MRRQWHLELPRDQPLRLQTLQNREDFRLTTPFATVTPHGSDYLCGCSSAVARIQHCDLLWRQSLRTAKRNVQPIAFETHGRKAARQGPHEGRRVLINKINQRVDAPLFEVN